MQSNQPLQGDDMTLQKSIQTGIWAAAAGMALTAFAPLASAQPRPADSYRDGPGAHQPAPPPPHQPAARPGKGPQHPPGPPAHAQGHGPRGAGPDHNLYRGGKLPPHYRTKHYVVDDWRGHHLQRPGRGQQWVQVGSDYLLVAVATGLIAQVITH